MINPSLLFLDLKWDWNWDWELRNEWDWENMKWDKYEIEIDEILSLLFLWIIGDLGITSIIQDRWDGREKREEKKVIIEIEW